MNYSFMYIAKTNEHIHSTILFLIWTQRFDPTFYEVILLYTSACQLISDLLDPLDVGAGPTDVFLIIKSTAIPVVFFF